MAFLTKCCFCVPLRPGCLVVAYLNLIGTIIGLLMSIYLIVVGASMHGSPQTQKAYLGSTFLGIGVILLIFLIAAFSFSIVLLVGLHKNKPEHVKAYLIFSLVFLIIYAILLLVRLISGLGGIVEGVVNLLVSLYFLLVIKSYHIKMLEDKPVNVQKV